MASRIRQLKLGYLVTQLQALLFKPPQHDLIDRHRMGCCVYQRVNSSMLNFQINQVPRRRMVVQI
jgi:hypothetical protein